MQTGSVDESRALRLARRALNAAAANGGVRPDAMETFASHLGRWCDRYLHDVPFDEEMGLTEPSTPTHRSRENALSLMRIVGLAPPGPAPALRVGVVDPHIADFAGDAANGD